MVRGETRDEAIRLAVEKLGGIRHIIDSPAPALLKPNFNSADPFPASTHPDTLETVVTLLKEAGCDDLAVGEMGGLLSLPARANFERWGMNDFQERTGVSLLRFDEEPWVKAHAPEAIRWGGWVHCIERLLRPGQHVVNLPTMKSHGGGPRFSLSLKNVYGFVHPRDRVRAHFVSQMAEMIMETNLLYSPSLIVLDGTKCWISGGPYTGEERAPNVMIVGDDRHRRGRRRGIGGARHGVRTPARLSDMVAPADQARCRARARRVRTRRSGSPDRGYDRRRRFRGTSRSSASVRSRIRPWRLRMFRPARARVDEGARFPLHSFAPIGRSGSFSFCKGL